MRLTRRFARWFSDPVYRVNYFVVCVPRADFIETLRALVTTTDLTKAEQGALIGAVQQSPGNLDGCNGRCYRLSVNAGKGAGRFPVVVIWVLPGVDVTVVMHECWHALYWVFQHRGVQFDDGEGADEPVAYYLQSLVRRALGLRG